MQFKQILPAIILSLVLGAIGLAVQSNSYDVSRPLPEPSSGTSLEQLQFDVVDQERQLNQVRRELAQAKSELTEAVSLISRFEALRTRADNLDSTLQSMKQNVPVWKSDLQKANRSYNAASRVAEAKRQEALAASTARRIQSAEKRVAELKEICDRKRSQVEAGLYFRNKSKSIKDDEARQHQRRCNTAFASIDRELQPYLSRVTSLSQNIQRYETTVTESHSVNAKLKDIGPQVPAQIARSSELESLISYLETSVSDHERSLAFAEMKVDEKRSALARSERERQREHEVELTRVSRPVYVQKDAASYAVAGSRNSFTNSRVAPPFKTVSHSTLAKANKWLNTESGVRHKASCQHFNRTNHGHMCTSDEGVACKKCGG